MTSVFVNKDVRRAEPADLGPIRALLAGHGLPLDGLEAAFDRMLVYRDETGGIIGCAGIEVYPVPAGAAIGLLRSVAVDPAHRGRGIGADLAHAVLQDAQDAGIAEVYLLTTTAAGYWQRHGFVPIDRDQLPQALSASAEVAGACPASAQAMQLRHSNFQPKKQTIQIRKQGVK